MKRLLLVLSLCASACTPAQGTPGAPSSVASDAPNAPNAPNAPTQGQAAPPSSSAKVIPERAPLEEGHVAFVGMVRPTKGGYDVRGAIFENDALSRALAEAGGDGRDTRDWFLGAIVRVTAELRKVSVEPGPNKDIQLQIRSGTWFQVVKLESVALVAEAQVIEGTLVRSKGYFALQSRLISEEDLRWSLAPNGAQAGDRVRLHGQPRTLVCEPNAQCLMEGSLPLFDVARAERLP